MVASVQQNEYGKIFISDQVIASIAGWAALESYGLVGMAAKNIQDGIGQLLGKDSLAKGITVDTRSGNLVIDVYVVVSYGIKISEVAQNAMEKVRYAVEKATGLTVSAVNIIVQGVKVMD
ncbi:MAG TPA: Asp23/Gls24 family envelope stress response protein [Clostridia bacterium]|nr:Asp23/Gls24 family envelope stress response protein [Clostridia bacterium]